MAKREDDIAILEWAATTTEPGNESRWIRIMRDIVKLPMDHLSDVWEVLRQGRWMKAADPVAYIRVSVKNMCSPAKLNAKFREDAVFDLNGFPEQRSAEERLGYLDQRNYDSGRYGSGGMYDG